MITSFLMGGLGNQMFQYAFAKSVSMDLNTELYLDTRFFEINTGVTPRKFSLNKFPNLQFNLIQEHSFRLNKIDNKQLIRLTDINHFNFKKFDLQDKYNYFLEGYWQTEKYFENRRKEILNEFIFTDNFKEEFIKKYPELNEKTTSLHVRRTDYLILQENHTVQSEEYFDKSIEIINDYDYLFIFSDDIEWCKNNLKFKNMIFIEGNEDIEDMWLMSMCNNNIIANSSFSWWAAWMNSNPSKKIIAPKSWFGPKSNLNDSDIIPETWIKI